jgi:cytidine deaminase
MPSKDQQTSLIEAARQARQSAYAPYSKYSVGAALLTKSGKVYSGANIENAAYPDSICAERVAVFKAVMEGERDFAAIAVVTQDGGSPCGSCRQVLAEFSLDARVLIANDQGVVLRDDSVADLLPEAFSPKNKKLLF